MYFPYGSRCWVDVVNPDSGESLVDVYNEDSVSSELTRHTPTILQILTHSNCASGIFGTVLVYNGMTSRIQSVHIHSQQLTDIISTYITFISPVVQGLPTYNYYNFYSHVVVIFNHELHSKYMCTHADILIIHFDCSFTIQFSLIKDILPYDFKPV